MQSLPDPRDYPPGTIGVLSGELCRWAGFAQSLRATLLPPGTQLLWCESQWIAGAVNEIIRGMQPGST